MRFAMVPKLPPARSCLAAPVAALVAVLVMLWTTAATAAAAAQFQLLMFERDGCSYCRQWNEEIGPAYPKTAEGQAAPLHRLDVNDPLPAGMTLTGRHPVFTPTFVLLSEGTEVGRIEGYAGDEFFWVLLTRMMEDAGWSAALSTAGLPAGSPASDP